MQAIDIPRFNFIELSKEQNLENPDHTYFVTTDVIEAANQYLHMVRENESIYMTISSIDGKVCVAKSRGLSCDHTKPKIVRIKTGSGMKTSSYTWFTDEFVKIVEKKLS